MKFEGIERKDLLAWIAAGTGAIVADRLLPVSRLKLVGLGSLGVLSSPLICQSRSRRLHVIPLGLMASLLSGLSLRAARANLPLLIRALPKGELWAALSTVRRLSLTVALPGSIAWGFWADGASILLGTSSNPSGLYFAGLRKINRGGAKLDGLYGIDVEGLATRLGGCRGEKRSRKLLQQLAQTGQTALLHRFAEACRANATSVDRLKTQVAALEAASDRDQEEVQQTLDQVQDLQEYSFAASQLLEVGDRLPFPDDQQKIDVSEALSALVSEGLENLERRLELILSEEDSATEWIYQFIKRKEYPEWCRALGIQEISAIKGRLKELGIRTTHDLRERCLEGDAHS